MKSVQIGLHCDDIEVSISHNVRLTYDCVANMWESLLNGHSDVFTTLVMLVHFLSDASQRDLQAFCKRFSLVELWPIFRHSDNVNLQTLSLIGLTIAVQYKHPDLKVLRTPQNLDRLMNILNNPDEDICNEGMNLLTNVCEDNEEIIHYFLEKGILSKLKNIDCLLYFGSFLAQLTQYEIPSYEEVINLAIPCIASKYSNNVMAFFKIANQMIDISEGDEEIMNRLLEISNENYENLNSQADDFVVVELAAFLAKFEHVPQEYCKLCLTLISNSFLPDATGRFNIIQECLELLNHFAADWTSASEEVTTFIVQIYKTQNFTNQKLIALNVTNYFAQIEDYLNDIVRILVTFMDDPNIGAKCIEKLAIIFPIYQNFDIFKELIDDIVDKCLESMTTDDVPLVTASEELYRLIQNY